MISLCKSFFQIKPCALETGISYRKLDSPVLSPPLPFPLCLSPLVSPLHVPLSLPFPFLKFSLFSSLAFCSSRILPSTTSHPNPSFPSHSLASLTALSLLLPLTPLHFPTSHRHFQNRIWLNRINNLDLYSLYSSTREISALRPT